MAEEKKIIFDKEGKDTGEAEGPDDSSLKGYAKWMLRQGGIGLADTPGAIAGLYGLGGAVKDYLYDRVDPTYTPEKGFAQNLFDPAGGEEKLKAYNQKVIEDIQRARPDAAPEDVQKRFEEITKHSKRYYEETTPFYRQGLAFARKWGQGTNEFFGDPRLPPERTQADTLMNIVGSAAPTRGIGAVTGATGAVGRGLASVAATKAGRIGLNVAEALTPVTVIPKGATAGEAATRVGANIAIPAAIDQAVRYSKGDPSIVADTVEAAKDLYSSKEDTGKPSVVDAARDIDLRADLNKKDDGSAGVATVGAAGLFATLFGARRLRNVSAGPTTHAMSQAAYPTVNALKMGAAKAGSDVEPFRVMAKEGGLTNDEIDLFMTNIRQNAGNNPIADHRIWYDSKVSPIVEKFARDDPAFQEKFLQHAADADRIRGDTDALARTNDLLTDAQAALTKAQGPRGRSTPARLQELQDEVNTRLAERNARLADVDPNLRYSMMNEDKATVQARLNQSRQDPRIRAVEQQLQRLYDDPFDLAVREGAMSNAEGQRLKLETRMGNYHLTDNPMAQKNFLQRVGTKLMNTTEGHILNTNPEAVLGLYRMANRSKTRKGYQKPDETSIYTNPGQFDVPHPRTNNPRDPFSELKHVDIRVRQAIAHNNARRDYTNMMLGSRNYNPRKLEIVKRIPEKEIPQNIKWVESKVNGTANDRTGYYYTYRERDGGLVLVRHNEKAIHEALKFAPAAVVPIMNQMRKTIQAGTTGWMNPGFALRASVPFDIIIGGVARHSNMAFGPISRLAISTFGYGHPVSRILSAIGAGVDIPYNLILAWPASTARALISEALGNQLAKKWQADLAMNTGTISMIAKAIPGGRQLIGHVADIMSKAYDTSWTNLTKTMKAGHVAGRSDDVLARMNEVNAVIKKRPILRSVGNFYLDMLNVFNDVPKQMALSQNLKLWKKEVAKGRQQSIAMNEKFIADQAAMIGGDMRRVSGSRWVQQFTSMVPWSNTALQSLRYMKQRILENPAENLTRLGSLGFASMWAYYMVSRDPEASDWFFNQLPNDTRAQSIPIPDFQRWASRSLGLNIPYGRPDEEFTLQRMPPEVMMFVLPMLHGARALGLLPSKDIVVPPSIKDDMAHAMEQTFGLAVPPAANAIAAQYGKKIEPGKAFSGGSIFNDIRDFKFSGANADKMSPQSRIPHAAHDTINALFGTVIGTMLEAANYGDVVANDSRGSVTKGIKEGTEKFLTTQAVNAPGISYIWPDVNRRYIYTPAAEKLQKDMATLKQGVTAQMAAEPGLRRVLQDNARINATEKTGALPGAVVGAPVTDPDLRAIMAQVYKGLLTGPFQQLEEQRRIERSRHQSLTIGPNPTRTDSPLMRYKMAQEQAKKVNDLDRRMYTLYQDQWKMVESSPSGIAFAKKYGPLTPENLTKAIQGSAREGGQRR